MSDVDLPTELYIENAKLWEENLRLRDKLLEIAKACSGCDGTGLANDVTYARNREGRSRIVVHVVPCPDCDDIRKLLE